MLLLLLLSHFSPTPCDPIDGSPPGSSVHGIFQARVLEWSAIAFSDKGPYEGVTNPNASRDQKVNVNGCKDVRL